MADETPDTPEPTTGEQPPAPRRRAAPRKTPVRKSKGVVAKTEEAATRAVTAAKDAIVSAEQRAVRAVKPRSTTRAASRPAATRSTGPKGGTTKKADAPKKPRKATTRTSAKNSKSTLDRATSAVGGGWAAAAIASVAAVGATAAAVLTLRGSSARNLGTVKKPIDISASGDKEKMHPQTVQTGGAHQPDGTDSSASFQAGIADENTVPGKA